MPLACVTYQHEFNIRVLYWGCADAGKMTNLEKIYAQIPPNSRGEIIKFSPEPDHSVSFFDFRFEPSKIAGFKIRCSPYATDSLVHLQTFCAPWSSWDEYMEKEPHTNSMGIRYEPPFAEDGIVFVADAAPASREANVHAIAVLRRMLAERNRSFDAQADVLWQVPLVVQFNKRDQTDAMPVEQIKKDCNLQDANCYEAVASEGKGVSETLNAIVDACSSSKRVAALLRYRTL